MAKGVNPRLRTHAMNQATEPYATIKDTMNPIARMIHWSDVICETPIGFSPFPRSDLYNVYSVAAAIVGIERKKENSRAEARDIPAICPAAIVDMEREVPGNTPEKIWQKPIQMDCPRLISSIFQVRILLLPFGPAASALACMASTIHITIPPMSKEYPMIVMSSRCLPMTFVSRNDGIAVTTKAIITRLSG